MSAILSECGQYRWILRRPSRGVPVYGPALFLLLNPSTADGVRNDPTSTRLWNFADAWGGNGYLLVNLYGLRATQPTNLWKHPDPVGHLNDAWIAAALEECETVICAWGANARPDRVKQVVSMFRPRNRPMCLGITKSGAPKHPLYIRADQQPFPWRMP